MVTLPNSKLFECSINEEMLDYNGKNFLADGCAHRRDTPKRSKILKKASLRLKN